MDERFTKSEPTTGELVSALRTCNNRKGERCSQCPVFSKYGYPRTCKRTVDLKAAERLESQEREIERLRIENKAMDDHVLVATGVAGCFAEYLPVTICGIPIDEAVQILSNRNETEHAIAALTARAEQAEKERDAANERVTDYELSSRGF